ncbi:LSM12 homolog A isoform X2 [Musca domestica]|uniref:Protein LSM12 homolog A isoform X2 n=2 Tax=Musca domestica TaxID=7370 RepID=A0A1I8NDQ7_MUSDO|nr:LSM12 homolog A isoform X2 [Musca domestica]
MAAVNDCFSIGSTVNCTTCFNEEFEGEVLAFDHNTKMLILKCRSKNSEQLNDVHVLNLSLCSNVQVVKECNGNFVEDPQKLNLEQVKIRLRKTVQHRQTYLKSKNADVSPEAQELYRVIAKQFKSNEVSWQGLNIQIFKEVTIKPPYRAENVICTSSNKNLCNYIKKMIENFVINRAAQENASVMGTSSASSPTSSSLSSSNAASGSPVPANS